MTGGITYTPSHTNVCKFLNFQPIFFFNQFSAAILEKGLLLCDYDMLSGHYFRAFQENHSKF